MKKIVLAFAMLAASSAMAAKYSADMSWDQLNKAYDLDIQMPTVFMGSSVSYDMICVDGNNLRTIKPVDVTEQYKINKEQVGWKVVGQKYRSTPINYTSVESVCVTRGDHDVCHNEVITGSYPTTVNVTVNQYVNPSKTSLVKFLFKKSFTLPSCNTVAPAPY
jgi:hypothetical protein